MSGTELLAFQKLGYWNTASVPFDRGNRMHEPEAEPSNLRRVNTLPEPGGYGVGWGGGDQSKVWKVTLGVITEVTRTWKAVQPQDTLKSWLSKTPLVETGELG